MKISKKQMVIKILLTGKELTSKDIARKISEKTKEKVTTQSISSILSKISDEQQCSLGHFIISKKDTSPYVYKMVPEALSLSEEKANGLTLKTGKNFYNLENALQDFPVLKKYVAPASKSKSKVNDLGKVYQMKITLQGIKPPVWRRIEVIDSTTLDELSDIIQIAMGWEGYHLHQFVIHNMYFGTLDPNFPDNTKNEAGIKLSEIIHDENYKFIYDYDFGDGWSHKIVIEKIKSMEAGKNYPVCIQGKRACPPEDVGGIWGYMEFLEAVLNKNHPEHEAMLEWAGESFDPEDFDIKAVNRMLKKNKR